MTSSTAKRSSSECAGAGFGRRRPGHHAFVASYAVNDRAVERCRRRIDARQYVLESDWGEACTGQP